MDTTIPLITTESKRCTGCKHIKPIIDFYPTKTKSGEKTYRSQCKECVNARSRGYYQKNRTQICASLRQNPPDRSKRPSRSKEARRSTYRRDHLKKDYELTLEGYESILQEQNGVCAICGKPETAVNQYGPISLSVDHDHKTGKIRGLLCRRCNTNLGIFENNFSDFTQYLNRHQ